MTDNDNPRVLIPPPLMFAALVGMGLFIDGGPPADSVLVIVAGSIGAVGLAFIVAALDLFFRSNTRPEPWRPASQLVSTGPYRLTRNPMYLGLTLIGLALALALTSVAAALLALLAAFIVDQFVIKREEAYLRRRFGDDYERYCGRVGRWI